MSVLTIHYGPGIFGLVCCLAVAVFMWLGIREGRTGK